MKGESPLVAKKVKWQGVALVALGALGFSSGIIFNRCIVGLGALHIAFFRALAGFLFFSALLPRHPQSLRVREYRGAVQYLLGLGLAVGLTAGLYIYAVRQTTAANAVLLNNTSMLYVALLAPWLLGEERPRYTGLSLGLALVGIILIANPASLELRAADTRGIMAGALSGITYAGTMLFSRRLRGRVDGLTQIWWSTGSAALIALPGAFNVPWAAFVHNLPYLLALGIIALASPYLLYFWGLERVKAQVVSVVALLEPVSGILIGLLIYQELPGLLGALGMMLVLVSILLIVGVK
ncbi:MAG: DMT family transporter [Chloroflexota bacterium]|nr:DMT family transporter [Chloroflexota bacterium]